MPQIAGETALIAAGSAALTLMSVVPSVSLGLGGQPRVIATHAASGARLEVYLHGAHVTSFSFGGAELLYTSKSAIFDGATPIRGGIPIAFPQFGNQGPLPAHGFARTSLWSLGRCSDGFVELELRDSEKTRAMWGPHIFSAKLNLTFAEATLTAALSVSHEGASGSAPFPVEALLHAYLNVGPGAVTADGTNSAVHVVGLCGQPFVSKCKIAGKYVPADPIDGSIAIVGEIDRVYAAPKGDEILLLGAATGGPFNTTSIKRSAAVTRSGDSFSTPNPTDIVVWNPAAEKNAAMKDLDPDAWTRFVCIEPGVVSKESAVTLSRGDKLILEVVYKMQ